MLELEPDHDQIVWLGLPGRYMHSIFGAKKNLFSLEFVGTSTQWTGAADNLGANLVSNLTSLR